MSPPGKWLNGNAYTPFAEMLQLERVEGTEDTFRSCSPAFSPGSNTRAYGGHVYAQAAWAAAQTVGKGFCLHSITGWFTLQGDTSRPFVYRVRNVRQGGSYCQRQVDVWQEPDLEKGVCFTAICSFKRPEPTYNDRQHEGDLRAKYKAVLDGKRPEDWPEAPGVDSPYYWTTERERGYIDPFPGLQSRKVDMSAYNEGKATLEKRQLQYYSIIGDMPPVKEQPNLHACAHLYASDRNGLFPIPNFLDLGDQYQAIASLSHTVILHVEADGLNMIGPTGKPYWFLHEIEVTRIAHGRAMTNYKLWREDGVHVATCVQDGLLRMPPGVAVTTAFAARGKKDVKTVGKGEGDKAEGEKAGGRTEDERIKGKL
ncbi:Thioesterase/thiol ester dehydrase-isomerase [Trichodelitschia bisporula]|uniref:Thioesterase/thiol ester dehydrase-isomerase n=1 Tax=Trichodelitschia bisporula TaxID=703511 RepID=A0A6G1HNV1_9PEZI|nr:Thioesterase/thiol ester dehydrase-isomerase [Trichodelitschia bisporula]